MGAADFDPIATARQALACLDLTSLNDADTEADIATLCQRATGQHGQHGQHGAVAAVCVWPRFARLARSLLPPHVAVAAVANFPDGSSDVARAVRDTASIVEAGAQEVDVVIPYRDLAAAPKLLSAVRLACEGLTTPRSSPAPAALRWTAAPTSSRPAPARRPRAQAWRRPC